MSEIEKERSLIDQEVEIGNIMRENIALREDLAAANAQIASLQEKTKPREKDVNEITDISTFHSTDKLDLERKNIIHYFVASSHYYKMRTQARGRTSSILSNFFGNLSDQGDIDDDDHNLTITYIENGNLNRNFEKSKKDKEDNGEHFEEILLFHGTDEENIDSLFNNNFDINHQPQRRSKVHNTHLYF